VSAAQFRRAVVGAAVLAGVLVVVMVMVPLWSPAPVDRVTVEQGDTTTTRTTTGPRVAP
jgi:hypothetical protein